MRPKYKNLLPLLLAAATFGADSSTAPLTGNTGATPTTAGTRLEEVAVTASKTDSAASTVDNTATKLPQALHETPRSVTVVDSVKIRDRNYNSVDDLMDTTPGVFVNSRNAGGYHYISRGFRMTATETLIDGFRAGYTSGQNALPLYGVESVTFLRGPSSLTYGAAAAPGGLINITMRKPEEVQKTTLDIAGSTYAGNDRDFADRGGLSMELDSTGALSDRYLYRVGLAGDSLQSYSDAVTNRTAFGTAAITWKPLANDRVKITPVAQYLRISTPPGAGMVISPTSSLSTNDGSTKIDSDNLSSLDHNAYSGTRRDEVSIAGFDIRTGDPTEATLNAGYRFMSFETDLNAWSPVLTTPAQITALQTTGLISRTQSRRTNDNNSHNFDLNGTLECRPATFLRNHLLLGVNLRQLDATTRNGAGPLNTAQSPYDIYTGQASTPLADLSTGLQAPIESESVEWNTYLVDQASLFDDRLVLTGGLGYGRLHTAGRQTLDGELTPNAAALLNITREVAVYTAYSTSYAFADPGIAYEDAAGNRFSPAPSSGDNREVGTKLRLPDRKTNLTAAYFWTKRTQVLTQSAPGVFNPNGNRYYFTQDGQRAEGVELASELCLTDEWHLDGSFAWITGSYGTGAPFDQPLAKTPEYSFSLFSRHRFTSGSLKGLGHYIGVVWQDDRLGGNGARTAAAPDPLTLPAFYRVDAGIDYTVSDRFKLGFHIYNLLDEVIVVDGTHGGNIQIDAPRTFTLKATYAF